MKVSPVLLAVAGSSSITAVHGFHTTSAPCHHAPWCYGSSNTEMPMATTVTKTETFYYSMTEVTTTTPDGTTSSTTASTTPNANYVDSAPDVELPQDLESETSSPTSTPAEKSSPKTPAGKGSYFNSPFSATRHSGVTPSGTTSIPRHASTAASTTLKSVAEKTPKKQAATSAHPSTSYFATPVVATPEAASANNGEDIQVT